MPCFCNSSAARIPAQVEAICKRIMEQAACQTGGASVRLADMQIACAMLLGSQTPWLHMQPEQPGQKAMQHWLEPEGACSMAPCVWLCSKDNVLRSRYQAANSKLYGNLEARASKLKDALHAAYLDVDSAGVNSLLRVFVHQGQSLQEVSRAHQTCCLKPYMITSFH